MKATRILRSLAIVSVLFAYACSGSVEVMADHDGEFDEWASREEAALEDENAWDEAAEDAVVLGTLEQGLGGSCGSTTGALNSVFNYTTVPDHFPPDSPVALGAALAIGTPVVAGGLACASVGIARLSPTCEAHDACYATLGKTKSECDRAARDGWQRECMRAYKPDFNLTSVLTLGLKDGVEKTCQAPCLGMADLMFAAISKAGQSAYDAAQRDALRRSQPRAANVQGGPIFCSDGSCL